MGFAIEIAWDHDGNILGLFLVIIDVVCFDCVAVLKFFIWSAVDFKIIPKGMCCMRELARLRELEGGREACVVLKAFRYPFEYLALDLILLSMIYADNLSIWDFLYLIADSRIDRRFE